MIISVIISLFIGRVFAGIMDEFSSIFQVINNSKPGSIINLSDMRIKVSATEDIMGDLTEGTYYIFFPKDIDIKRTDTMPYKKDYPNLHLNLPLSIDSSPVVYLVVSDQPESITETNVYLDKPGPAIDGLYQYSTVPKGKRFRFLADHFNDSKLTKWVKIFLTSKEDAKVIIHKKGSGVADNSVVSGTIAETLSRNTILTEHLDLKAGIPYLLESIGPLKPGQTAVAWYEMTPTESVSVRTVVTDRDKLVNPTEDELNQLPKLKSFLWKDKEEKLKKIVKKEDYPSRYARVMESFIHARGIFKNPDRYCVSVYDFKKNPYWIQFYSPFEYIEGSDELTADGIPVKTNNRGNYGCYVRTNIKIKSLPEGCKNIAVFAVNNSDTIGGLFTTSLNNITGETVIMNKNTEIMKNNKAVLLWKGEAGKNSDLNIQFYSLANTSVRMWYMLIPY